MKNLLFSIFTILSLSVFGQVQDTSFLIGKVQMSQSGAGSGYWQVSGTFTDESGLYDSGGIQVGDVLFFSDAGVGYHLPITLIVSATPPSFAVRVSNTGITNIISVPTGSGVVYRPSAQEFLTFAAGISNPDQQTYQSFLAKKLDAIMSGGPVNTIYNSSDSLQNENHIVKMATDGSQAFGVGSIASFPSWNYGDYGILIGDDDLYPGFFSRRAAVYFNNGDITNDVISPSGYTVGRSIFSADYRQYNHYLVNKRGNRSQLFGLDSLGFRIASNVGDNNAFDPSTTLRFPDLTQSYPSTSLRSNSSLVWTGNGSTVEPTFKKGMFYHYTSGDSLYSYTNTTTGYLEDANYWGWIRPDVTTPGKQTSFYTYENDPTYPIDWQLEVSANFDENSSYVGGGGYVGNVQSYLTSFNNNTQHRFNRVMVDTFGVWHTGGYKTGGFWQYRFPRASPSTTSGVTNILKWVAGNPSFGEINNDYEVTISGGNTGSKLYVRSDVTGVTASFASNQLTITIPGNGKIHSADWRLVASDVQASADGGGVTNWVKVRFVNTSHNTSIDDMRCPDVQKVAIPTSGALSETNAATYDIDSNPAPSVIAVGGNAITLRIGGLSVGGQGYNLKFSGI